MRERASSVDFVDFVDFVDKSDKNIKFTLFTLFTLFTKVTIFTFSTFSTKSPCSPCSPCSPKTSSQPCQPCQPFCAWRQAEMLKTTLHKKAKVCKNGFSERKSDFSCNTLRFSGLRIRNHTERKSHASACKRAASARRSNAFTP